MSKDPGDFSGFMVSLKAKLHSVKTYLDEAGYKFDYPDEALPGVSDDTEEVVAHISTEIGDIPEALNAFYRQIGSVNFCGHHKNWTGCEYPNPLVIYSPDAALAELEEYFADQSEYDKCYGSFRIPISPDYYHKEDVSGGMWYGIRVPAESSDPLVLEEHHNIRFLEYLNLNSSYGFFLGLENQDGSSTWPLAALQEATNRHNDEHK